VPADSIIVQDIRVVVDGTRATVHHASFVVHCDAPTRDKVLVAAGMLAQRWKDGGKLLALAEPMRATYKHSTCSCCGEWMHPTNARYCGDCGQELHDAG
jgi:uncharacterized paraquat-inducible protein A